MSCSILKEMLAGEDCYFAEPQFSSDNAAGIAHLARRAFLQA
jgi:tRNA A37 threonylcarbamoyltransferase TsaD